MASLINFVSERRKKLTRNQEQDTKLLKWACISLVITCVLYGVSLGVSFYYQSAIKKVKAQEELKRKAIVEKEPIEKSYSIFAHKLTVLTELYEKRKDKQEALAFFSNLFGSDVEITGLNYTADSDVLTFSLRSRSVFVMKDVFELLTSSTVTDVYPNISKTNLNRGIDGTYDMSLTIVLGELEEKISSKN